MATADDSLGAEDALIMAAADGDLDVVVFSVEMLHVDCDIRDLEGTTPLIAACSKGCGPIAEFLISKGADVNAANDAYGWTAVIAAAAAGAVDCLRILHKAGAKLETIDKARYNALDYAVEYEQQACAEYLRDEAGVDHSDVWKEAVASLNASNDNPAPAPDAAATAPAAAGFDEAMSSAGAGGGCGGRLSSTELEGLDDLLPSSPARPFKKTGDDARSPFTPGKGGAAASFMSPFGKAAAAHFRSRPSITGRLSILGGRISLAPGAAAGKAGPFGAGASASTGASAPLSSLSESGIGLGDSMMRTPAAGAGGGGDDSDESMALLPPSAGSTRSNAALGGGGGSRLNLAKSVGANGEVPPPPAGDEDGSNISGWFGGAGGVQQRKSAGSSSSSSSSNSNSSSVGSATKAENLRGFFTQPTSSSAAAAAAPSSSSSTVTLQQLQGQVYRRASSTLPPGHIRLFSSNESEENQQYFCWTVAFIVLFLWLTVQRLFGCGAV